MPPGYTDEGLRAAIAIRREHPGTGILVLVSLGFYQGTGPWRSRKRPVPASGPSVARATIASVASVTVWVPWWALRSVAV